MKTDEFITARRGDGLVLRPRPPLKRPEGETASALVEQAKTKDDQAVAVLSELSVRRIRTENNK